MTMLITETASMLPTDVENTRLDVSPYATPSVTLQLKDASRLYVPAHLLWKSAELFSSDEDGVYYLDMPHDVAHVLVHHLFTDTYQCLRPKGSSRNEKLIAEFLTSIRVYIASRDCKLSLLEELAQAEIIRLGSEFRIPLIFDLVQEAYPNPNWDDKWLCQYLKSRLSILLTNPKELLEWKPTEQKATTINDILLKNILELLRENIISPHRLANGTHETSKADLPQVDVVPVQSVMPPKLAEPETILLDIDKSPVRNGIDTTSSNMNPEKNEVDTENNDIHTDTEAVKDDFRTIKNGINIENNDVNSASIGNNMGKSDSNASKSDDEITRNGVRTPVSKSGSCEPESPKGDHVINSLDHGVKDTDNKKDENFWGLSLKKKKKKKAAKHVAPESLQEGITAKT